MQNKQMQKVTVALLRKRKSGNIAPGRCKNASMSKCKNVNTVGPGNGRHYIEQTDSPLLS